MLFTREYKSQICKNRYSCNVMHQQPRIILSIETSCDDTCVAIMKDNICLSNIVCSQDHNRLGGVFPEYASRQHLELINPAIHAALKESQISIYDINMIAVTTEPGLKGSLIVGHTYANMLSRLLNIPMIKVNHLHGHILSVKYACDLEFPYGFLLISGGHSIIGIAHDLDHYEILGETVDDAAGECFDKVSRSLGLQQPWGPSLEQHAQNSTGSIDLPMPLSKDHTCKMSFSGLKTACIRKVQSGCDSHNLANSFQNTVALFLKNRIQNAIKTYPQIKNWGVVGGVAANQTIRKALSSIENIQVYYPPIKLCTDNALMIGYVAYLQSSTQRYIKNELH